MKKLLLSIIILISFFSLRAQAVVEHDISSALSKAMVSYPFKDLLLNGDIVWLVPGNPNFNHMYYGGQGLASWDGTKINRYYKTNGRLPNDTVYQVLLWKNQVIALTAGGVKVLDDSTFIDYEPAPAIGKPSLKIYDILEHGHLEVLATEDGLYLSDNGKLKLVNTSKGLNENRCIKVKANADKIYVSTQKAVYEYDTASGSVTVVYNCKAPMNASFLDMAVYQGKLFISDRYGLDSFSMNTACYANGKLNQVREILHGCDVFLKSDRITQFYEGHGNVIATTSNYEDGIAFMDSKGVRSYPLNSQGGATPCADVSATAYVLGYQEGGSYYLRRGDFTSFEESVKGVYKAVTEFKANNLGFAVGPDNFNSLPSFKANRIDSRDCKSTIFARSLWLGATNDTGGLHVAAVTYNQSGNDFSPGPLTLAGKKKSAWAEKYASTFLVEAKIIDAHNAEFKNSGKVTSVHSSISAWPVYEIDGTDTIWLAPFMDVNKNGYYDPANGDYPKIKGDESMFFVFNDNGMHYETQGHALNVQVKGLVWAVHCPAWSGTDTFTIYDNSVFVEYELTNRSGMDYSKAYLGQWNDIDLGNYADDYVGCMPKYNVAFGYNGDSNDEGKFIGFGANPPVQNMMYLEGPVADNDGLDNDNDGNIDNTGEQCLMGSFMAYNNDGDSVRGNPHTPKAYYNLMQGKWLNGSDVMNDTNVCRFMLSHGQDPDNPGMYWTEGNSMRPPADKRFLSAAGPFNWANGQTVRQVLVYHFMEGTYQSDPASQVKRATEIMKKVYDREGWKDCQIAWAGVEDIKPNVGISVYPVPTGDALHVHLGDFSGKAQLKVYDVQGREQLRFDNLVFHAGLSDLDISALSTGIYFIKLECNNTAYSARILKQ